MNRFLKYFVVSSILSFILLPAVVTAFSGSGSGTEEDPYQIENLEQLQDINSDLSAHYELTDDIDAAETRQWNGLAGIHLELDGENDYVDLGSANEADVLHQNTWTISGWIYVDEDQYEDYPTIISRGHTSDGEIMIRFTGIDTDSTNDQVIFYPYVDSSFMDNSVDITTEEWYHWAYVRDGEEWITYIDGEEEAVEEVKDIDIDSTKNLILGASQEGNDRYFKGMLDDFKIYDKALTESEIQKIYNNRYIELGNEIAHWKINEGEDNTIYDSSGNENHGEIQGATWEGTYLPKNEHIEFDGAEDKVSGMDTYNFTPDDDFTLSIWAKPNEYHPEGPEWSSIYPGLIGVGSGSDGYGITANYDVDNLEFEGYRFYVREESGGTSTGVWTDWKSEEYAFLVGIHDSDDQEIKFYVNGEFVGDSSVSTFDNFSHTDPLEFGGSGAISGNGENYPGYLDDARIYDRALTEGEIQFEIHRLKHDEVRYIPINLDEGEELDSGVEYQVIGNLPAVTFTC